MVVTRVFQSGNSLAIRIPKAFHLNGLSNGLEVEIFKRNDELVIREIPQNLGRAFEILQALSTDFYKEERVDSPPQKREDF